MKITPVVGAGAVPPNGTPESVRTAKAVAAFQKGASSYDKAPAANQQPEAKVVQNQNSIGVEELGAVMQPGQSGAEEEVVETQELASPEADIVDEEVIPKPAEKKVETADSRRYADLARREKAIRIKAQQQEQSMKAREAAMAAREAELTGKASEYSPDKYLDRSKLKRDPLQALAEAGVTYEELTQQILNQGNRDPRTDAHIEELRNEIKALRQANEETKQSMTQKQTADYNAAVKQIEVDVKNLVKMDPYFETIKSTNSMSDVVELITATYEKDGVLLSVEDAAKEVEDYLVDEAMKLTRIGKIKQRLAASTTAKVSQEQTPAPKKQTQMKTLTNAASTTRQLSAKERAILAFRGELK